MILNNNIQIILQVNSYSRINKDSRYYIDLDQSIVKADTITESQLSSPYSLLDLLRHLELWDHYNDIRQIIETASQGKGWIVYPTHIKTIIAAYPNVFPYGFSIHPKRRRGPKYPDFQIDLIRDYNHIKDIYTN